MKSLLIILTLAVILAALFCGGCSVFAVGDFLWHGRRMYFDETAAWITAGVGLVAAVVLAANIWILSLLLGRRGPRGRSLSKGVVLMLALVDIGAALLSLGLVGVFGGLGEVSGLLGVVVFAAFAAKGLLTVRWAASGPTAGSSGPPVSR
jgi:hypothetical protein